MERRPGLAREVKIGGDGDGVAFAEAVARGLGRMQDIQVHHDGLGPFRLAAVLPVGEVIQRTNGGIHGNKGLDAGEARERVVPGITLETRLGVGLHHQRAGTHRRKGGPLVPIVRVGDGGTPGAQFGGRHGHLDPGLFRPVPVGPGNPRSWIGLRHGAVDGKPRGLAHLFQKRCFHRFLSRGQDQLQIGAGVDVGARRPGAAFHRVDLGQAHRQGQAMEVDVGDAVARMAVLEDAEHEAFPWFHMERAVEKGAALDGLPADSDRQGVMPRGGLEERADRVGSLGRFEGDRSAMGPGGAVVQDDMGRIAAEKVNRLQHQAVAWAWVPAGAAPAQRAAPAREGEKAKPGGIFRLGDAGLPAALAEGQQDRRIGDPGAIVGDGDAGGVPSCSMVAATRLAPSRREFCSVSVKISARLAENSRVTLSMALSPTRAWIVAELLPVSAVTAFCGVDMRVLLVVDAGMKNAPLAGAGEALS